MSEKKKISRRQFLAKSAVGVGTFSIVPSYVLGGSGNTPPSEKLNIAAVGVGGMGGNNVNACENENIVALCDVDEKLAADIFKKYPDAKKYIDYRVMLEKEKNIDAVIIATPDHTHACIAMAAMQLGKHVYLQKPLTHSVFEARKLTEAARKYKVATQMGNQGHSGEGIRLICEWVWDGAIGKVREAHAWTNRPVWPQGIDKPKDTPAVPEGLNWDLWLGPAPDRSYHPIYHPFKWRGWFDFGTGALGDMGCHIIDPIFWSLKLSAPESVEASCATELDPNDDWKKWENNQTYPKASIYHYNFPARADMPAVKLHWYDGSLMPQIPDVFEPGRKLRENGGLLIGEKGVIMYNDSGESPVIVPQSRMDEYQRPERTIPRVKVSHEQNWIDACKGDPEACSNFNYAGPLAEAVLLGNIALRFCGTRLEWDSENLKFKNVPEANEFVQCKYRQGWSL
jgi:predicted dehydrogenase